MDQIQKLLKLRKKFQASKSPREISLLYDKTLNVHKERYKNTLYDWEKSRLADVINRRDFLINNCLGKVLDLGCGDGMFDIRLAQKGFDVTGIDMIENRVQIAKNNVYEGLSCKFFCGLIEDFNFKDSQYDTTIISHVLEHSYNPNKILEIASKVTKINGRIIVILPPSIGKDPTHIRYIPGQDIKRMLRNYGKTSNRIYVGPKSNAYICTNS